MKIRKNGKVISLTESDLRRIVRKVISEAYFQNSREEELEYLQGKLKDKNGKVQDPTTRIQNILTLRSDGKMGPQTKKCLRWFQKKMNLNPDGIVGPKTAEALLSNNGNSIMDWATPKQLEWCRSRNPKQTP